jgi:hypothetical protein
MINHIIYSLTRFSLLRIVTICSALLNPQPNSQVLVTIIIFFLTIRSPASCLAYIPKEKKKKKNLAKLYEVFLTLR